jgi:pimeloyl-ACP methyl ester carboxylesterase
MYHQYTLSLAGVYPGPLGLEYRGPLQVSNRFAADGLIGRASRHRTPRALLARIHNSSSVLYTGRTLNSMPILFLSALITIVFALLGSVAWFVLYLFRVRNHGWKTARITSFALVLGLPLLLFLVLPILFSWLIANASTRPQDLVQETTPADFGRSFSEVSFPSRDGLGIKGWLMKSETTLPSIIVGHGLFRNRQEVLERGCRLNEEGFPILLIDFRNHGRSEKKKVSLGYQERLDILGASDYLRSLDGNGGVVFAGVSMGAVASILAASEQTGFLRAVIADSPFADLEETVSQHTNLILRLPSFPFVDLFVWNFARIGGFSAVFLDTSAALRSIHEVPTLLIYGTADRRMPASVAHSLYSAAGCPVKKLVFIEGADHGGAYSTDPDRYIAEIVTFLKTAVETD